GRAGGACVNRLQSDAVPQAPYQIDFTSVLEIVGTQSRRVLKTCGAKTRSVDHERARHPHKRKIRRTTMKFRPLHDRVVVKRIDAEEKTAGGIIIPDTAKEKPSQGEIIAVGPGGRDESGKLIPIDLKVGDTVLFGKWSGTEVKIDGQDLLIMKESDI